MNEIQKKILLIFLVLPFSFVTGFIFEYFLIFIGNVDEYGYPKNKYFGWIYGIFHQRDGLYGMPNIFFYLFNFFICFLLIKLIFKKYIRNN